MNLSDIRIVFMGTPRFAVPSLRALLDARANVVGVVTRPDAPAGRGGTMQASPIAEAARARGLPVFQPLSLKKEIDRAFLYDLRPDLLVVVAYGFILPLEVLQLPKLYTGTTSEVEPWFGAVNVHASLLPKYRGAAPIPAAILTGETETGVTIMKMDEGVDTGPILAQEVEPVHLNDTTETLGERLAHRGARLLITTLEMYIAGALQPAPQPAGATRAPKLTKESGRIDWNRPAVEIERMVRAYTPWPHAYTFWHGQQLTLFRVRATQTEMQEGLPGTVVARGKEVGVLTGNGLLVLEELQRANENRLRSEEFLRGARGFVGARLGS